MLSVIIPSRNVPEWPFLQLTIDNLFLNAMGDIEVIVILDGFQPNPPIRSHKNLTLIYHPTAQGMRNGINLGVSVAKGKYILKCDDHCIFGLGYDIILEADCEADWLAVPSRYSLNGETWLAGENDTKKLRKYGPIDYLYLTPPHVKDDQFGWGLRGKKWMGEHGFTGDYFHREKQLKEKKIDDVIAFQGSCWFMHKSHFDKIGGMQEEGYYQHQEAQELGFKTFLSGGRCIVNKKTNYSHLHKGPTWGRGYKLLKHQQIQSNIYSTQIWMNNQWPGQVKKLKSYIEHQSWWPLEGWPEDWDNPERWKDYDYSIWHNAKELKETAKKETA